MPSSGRFGMKFEHKILDEIPVITVPDGE